VKTKYGDRYGYTARERDLETQLQYNRARYYDPASGRWITQDPLGFDAGDSNLYRYVNNQPVEKTDPTGLYMDIIGPGTPRTKLEVPITFKTPESVVKHYKGVFESQLETLLSIEKQIHRLDTTLEVLFLQKVNKNLAEKRLALKKEFNDSAFQFRINGLSLRIRADIRFLDEFYVKGKFDILAEGPWSILAERRADFQPKGLTREEGFEILKGFLNYEGLFIDGKFMRLEAEIEKIKAKIDQWRVDFSKMK
jgi:RHS repeat-associated protein